MSSEALYAMTQNNDANGYTNVATLVVATAIDSNRPLLDHIQGYLIESTRPQIINPVHWVNALADNIKEVVKVYNSPFSNEHFKGLIINRQHESSDWLKDVTSQYNIDMYRDFLNHFLEEVNWREIAHKYLESMPVELDNDRIVYSLLSSINPTNYDPLCVRYATYKGGWDADKLSDYKFVIELHSDYFDMKPRVESNGAEYTVWDQLVFWCTQFKARYDHNIYINNMRIQEIDNRRYLQSEIITYAWNTVTFTFEAVL